MQNSLAFLMHEVVWLMDRHADALLHKHFQLSFSRFYMMAALAHLEPAVQHDLACCLGYSDAAVSRMLNLLSQEGLVTQSPDPGHGRRRLASLSPRGREVFSEAARFLEQELARLLTSAQQDELKKHMAAIHERLTKEMK